MRKYNHIYLSRYTPIKGFYDLRNWDIPKKDFLSLWNIQKQLASYMGKEKYFKKYEPAQWGKLKELSVLYQQALFNYKMIGELK